MKTIKGTFDLLVGFGAWSATLAMAGMLALLACRALIAGGFVVYHLMHF
ncbi:MAG: hypothetical protein LV479_13375 [Methylacidiphilales bacterium]|nr:hypothetical protein [Candidatus Methylacidiphilales bacterium]